MESAHIAAVERDAKGQSQGAPPNLQSGWSYLVTPPADHWPERTTSGKDASRHWRTRLLDPGRILRVDPSLPPIDPDQHLVLRNLMLYVARNDGFTPEPYELARMTNLPESETEAILGELGDLGLTRFSGSGWYPTARDLRVPPVAERKRHAA